MDTFGITILFIALVTFVAAFVRRVRIDKCLKDFRGFMVTLEQLSGREVWGKLRVENTGLEFMYPELHEDADGHAETSFILYKHEFGQIGVLVRYHEQLSPENRLIREEQLKKTYHPGFMSRLKRKTVNVFKTVRDSLAEVMNLLVSRVKKTSGLGATVTAQDKYVNQMKKELMGTVGTSYEPLLEKYIGHKVVAELVRGEEVVEYCGVLKEYSADLIELMDVDYGSSESEKSKADMIMPRKFGVVRHLGE